MADNLSLKRMDRITGSRIAGVLGLSPYRTRDDVTREMIREHFFADPEFDGNIATEWGEANEHRGVEAYVGQTGLQVLKAGEQQETVVGGANGEFAVTPDGIAADLEDPLDLLADLKAIKPIEVKCPFRALYTSIWERPDYEQQVRLVAHVLDFDEADFVVWRPDQEGTPISTVYVDRDRDGQPFDWMASKPAQLYPQFPAAGEDTVASEVEKFLEEYAGLVDLGPDHPQVKPYLEGQPGYRYDPEWIQAAVELLELLAEQERINRAVETVQNQIKDLTPRKSAKGGGLHVVYRAPSGGGKGTVSWKKLAEAELAKRNIVIDDDMQDRYRGKGSGALGAGSYSFRRLGDAK